MIFSFIMCSFELLSCLNVQKLALGGPIIFVLLFILFFLPTMGHRMVADELVGLGSSVIGFSYFLFRK